MDILFSNQIDYSLSAPNLIKVVITIIIIYFAQLIEGRFARGKRGHIATQQRDLYYQRLDEEKLKMEQKDLQEELQQAKTLENLQNENDELRSQLEDEFDGSDWSGSIDDKVLEEKEELEQLQEQAQELKLVEKSICDSIKELKKDDIFDEPIVEQKNTDDISSQHESALKELTNRIKEIEQENEELKEQVKSYSSLALAKQSKLDPELQKYLEDHNDVLTLSFLEKAHETLLEIKALNPDKNFTDYIDELRCAQSNFDLELEKLRVSKKEAEIKLRHMKEEYEKELTSFNETRIEHLFRNCGAKEYLERLKDKNKLKDELIITLKDELSTLKAALADCEMKYQNAEAEYTKMLQGYQQIKAQKDQIEAERRAKERRILSQTMNLSSASSLVENSIPPIPPLNHIPSIDEVLRGP